MIGVGFRHAADGEVGIPDGLDPLAAVGVHDFVEPGEDVVEIGDEVLRLELRRLLREAHEIGEQHCDGRERLRRAVSSLLEFLGHLGREDVTQQLLRPLLLRLDEPASLLDRPEGVLQLLRQAVEALGEAAHAVTGPPAIDLFHAIGRSRLPLEDRCQESLVVGTDLLGAHGDTRAVEIFGHGDDEGALGLVHRFDAEDADTVFLERALQLGEKRVEIGLRLHHVDEVLLPRETTCFVEEPVGLLRPELTDEQVA